MPDRNNVIKVAIPVPLSQLFDYLPADPNTPVQAGMRVSVPFGPGKRIGFVVALGPADDPDRTLKPILAVLDQAPVVPPDVIELLQWASRYYHHPLGDAVQTALPKLLRRERAVNVADPCQYVVTAAGAAAKEADFSRAPVQWRLLEYLRDAGQGKTAVECRLFDSRWSQAIKPLLKKSLVEEQQAVYKGEMPAPAFDLNDEQAAAAGAVRAQLGQYFPILLHGVTGSGKTAVYIDVARDVVAAGDQILFIVPEIGLTPQLLDRLKAALNCRVEVLHSGLNDTERMLAWQASGTGDAQVLIGTRSAVFTPMPRLGLIVVDEEHDGSLKQQDGFRYHARDLALLRGRDRAVPVILGSATPALESLQNVARGQLTLYRLQQRAGGASKPAIGLLDVRSGRLSNGVSERLQTRMQEVLARGEQVIVFINRRGFAPVLMCEDCRAITDCDQCDAHMTVHARSGQVRCHHCGAERSIPIKCAVCESASLAHVGAGTERVDEYLSQQFPDYSVLRIDRDVTSRKGELERRLAMVADGEVDIIVGTQMLAKGHDFPNVTLVGILDADQGLFGSDFRSLEQMGQMIVQVAGRAGRADKPGTVIIQTRDPENPLLQLLIDKGYDAFARQLLQERSEAEWPPFARVALLRSDSEDARMARNFLVEVRDRAAALGSEAVHVLGPAHAPMEKIAGRYRSQLLFSSSDRQALHRLLAWLRPALEQLPSARKVRWSLDVDPHDML